ncbi:MAG: response regulator [Nitrospira sp.]|nr:response regulator [Nitrospira sp.]
MKILIVDDDAVLAEEMAEILRDEGHVVDCAFEARQGEIFIQQDRYDVHLFDYKMSDMSGVDLLKKAKKINPSGKILIISGRPQIEKLLEDENVADFVACVINKPFEVGALLQKIRALALQ